MSPSKPQVIESGTYAASNHRLVTHWPAPDKDGDGPEVYDIGPDGSRNLLTDQDGNVIHEYEPPEGFSEMHSSDNTSYYVRMDDRHRIIRNNNGEAVVIAPGQTLVEHPDGTIEYLNDDWERRAFLRHHELKVSGESVESPAEEPASTSKSTASAGSKKG